MVSNIIYQSMKEIIFTISNIKELNLRMPSGNEGGANELWLPGEILSKGYKEAAKGYKEAVINRIPIRKIIQINEFRI